MSNPGKRCFMPSPFQNKIHIGKTVPQKTTYKQNPEEQNQSPGENNLLRRPEDQQQKLKIKSNKNSLTSPV